MGMTKSVREAVLAGAAFFDGIVRDPAHPEPALGERIVRGAVEVATRGFLVSRFASMILVRRSSLANSSINE